MVGVMSNLSSASVLFFVVISLVEARPSGHAHNSGRYVRQAEVTYEHGIDVCESLRRVLDSSQCRRSQMDQRKVSYRPKDGKENNCVRMSVYVYLYLSVCRL